jgi:hypothetical protein
VIGIHITPEGLGGWKFIKTENFELNRTILMSGVSQPISPDINVLLHRPCVEHKSRSAEFILLPDVT